MNTGPSVNTNRLAKRLTVPFLMVIAVGAACGRVPLDGLSRGDGAAPDSAVGPVDAGFDETDARDAVTAPEKPLDGTCADGLVACGEGDALRCYDLTRSNEHCGACGQSCAPGINCQAGTCQQYHCKGALSFKALPLTENAFGSYAYRPAIGDFDGDGKLDLAGMPDDAGAMSLLYGAGDGTFPMHQIIDATATRWQALAADVDEDGLLDLATMSATSPDGSAFNLVFSPIAVRRGLGARNAAFDAPASYPTGDGLQSMLLADLDADGRLDLLTSVRAGFEYRRGQAGGQFAAPIPIASQDPLYTIVGLFPVVETVAADWNGDHKLDLVYVAGPLVGGPTLHFKLGHGDGTFDAEIACALGMGSLGDVDHDGRADLLTGANVLLGIDTCNPKKIVTLPDWPPDAPPTFADLDGDGNLDIVVDGKPSIRLGDGQGGFAKSASLPGAGAVSPSVSTFLFGDVNGDRKLDIVETQGDGWRAFLNTCP